MIDHENYIYTQLRNAVKAEYPDADFSSVYVNEPMSALHVSVEMRSNSEAWNTIDSSGREICADMMIEVNVYSTKPNTAKTEAKGVIKIISNTMKTMNFVRVFCSPVPNLDRGDRSAKSNNNSGAVYRLLAQFEGTADETHFYRR
jgi:hypothetical protein